MKYVKITAENYNDAMMQLRKQYGEDAIPISHKYIKEGGLFKTKFLAKDIVELTAAIHEKKRESAPRREVEAKATPSVPKNDGTASFRRALFDTVVDDSEPEIIRQAPQPSRIQSAEPKAAQQAAVEQDLFRAEPKFQGRPAAEEARSAISETKILEELSEMREILFNLRDSWNKDPNAAGRAHVITHGNLEKFRKILLNNDYTEEECGQFLAEITRQLRPHELEDDVCIEKTLHDLMKSKLVTTGPLRIGSRKKVLMLVGPTGVGKTTSLAKMGAIFALRENKRVAFVTIDTYRVAATEQLKKYAEIMNIPVHVVSDQKEFRSVLEKESADVILVDTSGRSHRNEMKISEIKSYADQVSFDSERILCVSATTKKSDLHSIFNAFDVMDCNSVLITKTDETSFIGNVVDVADKYNKPISYIANGQEVPNDLLVADAEKIVQMMLQGTSPQ